LASSKFLAVALTLVVVGVTAGAILVGTGISIPVSSSGVGTTAVQTSLVLQTVNLTQSYTTIVPRTFFTTLSTNSTKTVYQYSDTTRVINSTDVTTDLSVSISSVVTYITSSVFYVTTETQVDYITHNGGTQTFTTVITSNVGTTSTSTSTILVTDTTTSNAGTTSTSTSTIFTTATTTPTVTETDTSTVTSATTITQTIANTTIPVTTTVTTPTTTTETDTTTSTLTTTTTCTIGISC